MWGLWVGVFPSDYTNVLQGCDRLKKIILASASPRRVDMLGMLGLPFEQKISQVNETQDCYSRPEEFARALALTKARNVAAGEREGLVIGADTIVLHRGRILGKPRDREDAATMLRSLSGTRHQVISGLALVDAGTGEEKVDHRVTEVIFRHLSDEEINGYIDTGEPMDKAGAYGIQGIGSILIKEICGCYNNVVGLPLTLLVEMLKDAGVDVWCCISDKSPAEI